MKQFGIFLGFLLFIIVALFIFPFYNPDKKESRGKVAVTVTIFPIYDLVRQIGKERVSVVQVIPFGQEPHSFEPTPKEIIEISNSELFIYTGLQIDRWALDLALQKKKFLNLSKDLKIVKNDPHFWQDFENMERVAKSVTDRLVEIDEKNGEFYKNNLKSYLQKLQELKSQFSQKLSNCKLHSVIVNHNAFQYLGRAFDFETIPVLGLSPDNRPSAKTVSKIIDTIREKNISTLFFEELVSNRVVESISKETGAKISELSPLGNVSPENSKKSFFNLMNRNLANLQKALVCQ